MSRTVRNLIFVNCVLALTALGAAMTPNTASAAGWRDCCETSTEGKRFCCNDCCYFTHDCSVSGQCVINPS